MRPFEKDSQPVVTKGRRKSKLAAPKSKSTTAVVKRKSRNARRKQNDDVNDLSKEPCQFVPVRRKPLGEYMKLEEPMASPSPSVPGMRMTYAAAVQTGSGVKVMISPRLNKSNKSGKDKVVKIIADTKFQIFDEQPKPHIVRVDPKAFRADVERKSRMKSPKSKKAITQKASKIHMELANKIISNDVDYKALQLKLKSNASGTSTIANNENSLAIPNGKQTRSSAFVDSISYLSFHQARLQRIIQKQGICPITLQSPEPMKVPQFEDKHFKYLEEAALLAQNRSMLRLWMKSDRCSSK